MYTHIHTPNYIHTHLHAYKHVSEWIKWWTHINGFLWCLWCVCASIHVFVCLLYLCVMLVEETIIHFMLSVPILQTTSDLPPGDYLPLGTRPENKQRSIAMATSGAWRWDFFFRLQQISIFVSSPTQVSGNYDFIHSNKLLLCKCIRIFTKVKLGAETCNDCQTLPVFFSVKFSFLFHFFPPMQMSIPCDTSFAYLLFLSFVDAEGLAQRLEYSLYCE